MAETRMSGVLGRDAIKDQVKQGNIIIDPLIEENIQTTSVDVSLGPFYYRDNMIIKPRYFNHDFSYTTDSDLELHSVSDMWRSEYFEAQLYSKLNAAVDFKDIVIIRVFETDMTHEELLVDYKSKYILLSPGESILGHTMEYIGSNSSKITTMCKAKSTIGRALIEVCKCAGWGDVKYFNRWTLELTNNSKYHLLLKVGMPLAQIIFFAVDGCSDKDSYASEGQYQTTGNLEKLKAEWTPKSMLPKLKKIKNHFVY
jgi:dCTP deaminase